MSTAAIAARALPAPMARRTEGHVPLLGAALLCLALSAALQGSLLVTPLLTMHVFDGVLESRNLDTLAVLCIAFTLALVLGGVLRALRAALLAGLAERFSRRLQLHALAASVRVAVGGDRLRPTLALQDVAELRRMMGGTLLPDALDLLAAPVALCFLWLLHPLFFWVGFGVFVVKILLAVAAERATRGTMAVATAAAARASGDLASALRQADAVAGLGLLPALLRRWMPGWLGALEMEDAAQRRVKALHALLALVASLQQIAMVTAGAWLLTQRDCTPGAMLAATMMVAFATNPVVTLIGRWRDWAHGALAWRRLRALAEAAAPPAPCPAEPAAEPGLVFEDVSIRIASAEGAPRELVRGLTLRLAPGEAWAVLGPNGVGKTTLLRAALGLAPPASGRVLLDGQDTWRADRAAIGPRMGYLPQDAQLLDASVLENIARFGTAAAETAVAAARRAGAHEIIGRLHRGYETPAGPAAGLSGGQQRLVALARALQGGPRLLVLDEPEAGLDAPARAALRAAVTAAKAGGAVVLLVTHDAAPWAETLDGALRLQRDGGWEAAPTPRRAGQGDPA